MSIKEIADAAVQSCGRHTIVYTDAVDKMVAVRAMQGRTTKAIAKEFRLTMSEVQYRITKAQDAQKTKFRADARSGNGELAREMLDMTTKIALRIVTSEIAPKFIPLAAPGVPRR